ncbi:MAG: aldo/keto reductase [Gaiellaceae bacterium MAG52_C11]|nr:aldo/keto reductase [Candidatus Gaiellasilicea maunaloa]
MSAAETFLIGGELEVHRLGFGGMRLCGPNVTGWPEDRENAISVLRRARELGVDLFDTADAYGPEVNELQFAKALHPYEGIAVATKGGLTRNGRSGGGWPSDGRPEYLKSACEASLRRLRVETIELYQLHRPDPKTPFAESVGALRELHEDGKIRHVGLSNVSVAQLEEARRIVEIASVQNEYNLGNRESEGVLGACEREGIAFLPWYPLDAGVLARPGGPVEEIARAHEATAAQVALAWLLQRSITGAGPVTIPIPGTSSLAHLEENTAACELRLTDDDLRRLDTPA